MGLRKRQGRDNVFMLKRFGMVIGVLQYSLSIDVWESPVKTIVFEGRSHC